jgi:exodeoxyribonuclease VII large subunit
MEHLSLHDLNQRIAEVLASNLDPSYWVVAEIGQMQTNQKGHCYLELVEKEDQRIIAKTRATIWSYTYRNLSTWFEGITGQSLKSGMKILFNASIQFHEVYGLSLNIRDIDAQFTLGERAKKRQEIIRQLQEDGIFEMNKELNLPAVPQQVAVISSETAAGYGDFMDQIETNEYGYKVYTTLFHAVMQGDQAEAAIIRAMHEVFERVEQFDLLVIIRGGGATLDLDCFDSYELGSHVAQFPIPVITGIGHERDETIADMVAHTKMKTPTAVAEFIISGFRNFELSMTEHFMDIAKILDRSLEEQSQVVDQLNFRFQRISRQKLSRHDLELNNLTRKLQYSQQGIFRMEGQKLAMCQQALKKSSAILHRNEQLVNYYEKELAVLDPEHVIKRGYTITTIEGKNVNKIRDIKKGATIITRTRTKTIESKFITHKSRK